MLSAALLMVALAQEPPPRPAPVTGSVSGVVRGEEGGARVLLPHAVVEWRGANHRQTVTDGAALYQLTGLVPGRGELRVTRVGYEPLVLEVQVPPAGHVTLDLELRGSPVPLAPVTVLVDPQGVSTVEGAQGAVAATRGVAEANLRAAEAASGMAEAGLGAAVGRVGPGSGDPEDPGDVLFMRGSAAEQKLVLLDGAPVSAPFHVAGLIQGFDPATLGGAELHVGGAPARFDGGLAYILDLRTREPRRDRWQTSGALDLLSARAVVEGPVGSRGGVLLGSRALHGGGTGLLGRGPTPYGYGDALLRVQFEPLEGHTVRGTGFLNRESVRLDLPVTLSASELGSVVGVLPDGASWGNQVATLSWTRVAGGALAELQGSWSGYQAELPLRGERPVLADGSTDRGRLSAGISHGLGPWQVGYGVSVDHTRIELEARRLDPQAPSIFREAGTATTAGGYVEGARALGPEFHLRAGLRLDHFPGVGRRLAPRGALTWLPAPGSTVTLAAGRYHQLIRGDEAQAGVLLQERPGEVGLMAGTPLFQVLGASHLVLSLENQLTPAVRLGVDGYVKSFSGIAGAGEAPLRSSGLDIRAQREGERLRGWLGYSLSWLWAEEGGGQGEEATPFTGRHLLTAGIAGDLGERAGLELRVSFGDGLPLTGIEVGEAAGPVRGGYTSTLGGSSDVGSTPLLGGAVHQFLRVDGVVHGVVHPRVAGRRLELRPFLKLLNALDRRDALFYYFEPWRQDGLRPLATLSVLPVIGIEWRF